MHRVSGAVSTTTKNGGERLVHQPFNVNFVIDQGTPKHADNKIQIDQSIEDSGACVCCMHVRRYRRAHKHTHVCLCMPLGMRAHVCMQVCEYVL